jgi:hypothetical protein
VCYKRLPNFVLRTEQESIAATNTHAQLFVISDVVATSVPEIFPTVHWVTTGYSKCRMLLVNVVTNKGI